MNESFHYEANGDEHLSLKVEWWCVWPTILLLPVMSCFVEVWALSAFLVLYIGLWKQSLLFLKMQRLENFFKIWKKKKNNETTDSYVWKDHAKQKVFVWVVLLCLALSWSIQGLWNFLKVLKIVWLTVRGTPKEKSWGWDLEKVQHA